MRTMDHVVHPPVSGPGEAVLVLLTRGSIQGCGAGPGCEPVAVGEPGDVADSASVRAATTGPTPRSPINRDPRALTRTFSSAVAFFIFASTATRSASSSAAILRRVLAGDVTRAHCRQDRLGLQRGQVLLGLAGEQLGSSRCSRLTV
jgi:hypothetical protein